MNKRPLKQYRDRAESILRRQHKNDFEIIIAYWLKIVKENAKDSNYADACFDLQDNYENSNNDAILWLIIASDMMMEENFQKSLDMYNTCSMLL